MHNLLHYLNKSKAIILALALVTPVYAATTDTYSSTLSNQTKQYDPDGKGYTLEQAATWGKGCVVNVEKKSLAPGETSVLEIKPGCEWGGVRYDMIKDNKTVGSVSQSFRDKNFTIEVSMPCKDNLCVFTGLPPQEANKATAQKSQ